MTLQEAMNLDLYDASKLSVDELRAAIKPIRRAAGRRYERLIGSEYAEFSQVVTRGIYERLDLSTRGKTVSQLRRTLEEGQRYLKLKTSTVSGTKQYVGEILEIFDIKPGSDIRSIHDIADAFGDGEFWKWVDAEGIRAGMASDETLYTKAGELYVKYVVGRSRRSASWRGRDKKEAAKVFKDILASKDTKISADAVTQEGKWFAEEIMQDMIDEQNL